MPLRLPKVDLARILKKDSKYLFLCIANGSVGFGHLSRSLILASVFRDSGGDAEFLVFGSEGARARVIQSGFRCFFYSWAEDSDASWEMDDISDCLLSYDALIADVSHPVFFPFLADHRAETCISLIERFDGVRVVIDSVGEQSFLESFPTVGASLQVVPYVTDAPLPIGPWRTLKGSDYTVLSDSVITWAAKKRTIREEGDRVLVTCGGSDPTCLTSRIIESIQELSDPVELTVVIGPLFSNKLATNIRKWAKSCRCRVKVEESPISLLDLMFWCDVAVSTSGITKYELAATGTPAILVSIDSFHDQVNQPFANLGSVVDLGYRWSNSGLRKEIKQLGENQQRRYKMSQAGKKIVDGFGANRILKEVEAAIKC